MAPSRRLIRTHQPSGGAARLALCSLIVFLTGCVSGTSRAGPQSELRGATLRLVSVTKTGTRLKLTNSATTVLAYEHWMSQGPDPVPYCRNPQGGIRICASRVYLTHDDEPYVHESYLQPGASVRFQAVPSGDEQVGVRLWFDAREEYLWLESWTPDK